MAYIPLQIPPGALKATFFIGTATAANYADLAEMYLADSEYEIGTVLMVGGEKEVTSVKEELSENDYTWEQLKIMRIKFLSVVGN